MKITVALSITADGKYPSVVFANMRGADYNPNEHTLNVWDKDNMNRAQIPWSNVLYVLYDPELVPMEAGVEAKQDVPVDPYVLPAQPEGQSFVPPEPEEEDGASSVG